MTLAFCAWKRPGIRHDEAWRNQARDSGGCRMGIRSRGFRAGAAVRGVFGDRDVRIVTLDPALKKTACGCCGRVQMGWYDRTKRWVRDLSSAGFRIVLELEVRRVACRICGREARAAGFPGGQSALHQALCVLCRPPLPAGLDPRRCQGTEAHLGHGQGAGDAVHAQPRSSALARRRPTAIGIDEIAIRKGHNYRIVVSDLIRKRPIWFGGDDRSEASMAQFYAWLGPKKSQQNTRSS